MAARGLFLTGGAGFIGQRLLAVLAGAGRPIIALDRSGRLAGIASGFPAVTVVRGDLLAPESYRTALQSCDAALHLAAATGRAPAAEHIRTNVRGTETLLEACRESAVRRFLFVSSIATTFPDIRDYPYALSKRDAEEAVRRSGLRHLILRPTMVLGPGAPVLRALERLACGPIVMVPGPGTARVQPIHVDEVATLIAGAVLRDRFKDEAREIGGPDRLTMIELLQQIRRSYGTAAAPVLHVPLDLLRVLLRALETIGAGRMLPIRAGQLSSFRFDGLAPPLDVADGDIRLTGVAQMLDRAVARQRGSRLETECGIFTRYLLGCEPDAYVRTKYSEAHVALPALTPAEGFDCLLVDVARIGPRFARMADSYASLLAPRATLRKKLVLLLAILETRPPFHGIIDGTMRATRPRVAAAFMARGLASLGAFVAGALLFTPIRLALTATSRRRP